MKTETALAQVKKTLLFIKFLENMKDKLKDRFPTENNKTWIELTRETLLML
jgi:hypothetical protein